MHLNVSLSLSIAILLFLDLVFASDFCLQPHFCCDRGTDICNAYKTHSREYPDCRGMLYNQTISPNSERNRIRFLVSDLCPLLPKETAISVADVVATAMHSHSLTRIVDMSDFVGHMAATSNCFTSGFFPAHSEPTLCDAFIPYYTKKFRPMGPLATSGFCNYHSYAAQNNTTAEKVLGGFLRLESANDLVNEELFDFAAWFYSQYMRVYTTSSSIYVSILQPIAVLRDQMNPEICPEDDDEFENHYELIEQARSYLGIF